MTIKVFWCKKCGKHYYEWESKCVNCGDKRIKAYYSSPLTEKTKQ